MGAKPVPQPETPTGVRVSLWGLEFTIPLSKPFLYALASLLLLGAGTLALSKYFVVLSRDVWIGTYTEAIYYTHALPTVQMQEFQKHFSEKPEKVVHEPSGVDLSYYASDKCILVVRNSTGRPSAGYWVLDLSNVPLSSPPKSDAPSGSVQRPQIGDIDTVLAAGPEPSDSKIRDGFAAEDESRASHLDATPLRGQSIRAQVQAPGKISPVQVPAGHCWNPHPGQFNWWYGQVNGCFVQVWRHWPDGCTHFQWYNSCYNYFDPNITWTVCVH